VLQEGKSRKCKARQGCLEFGTHISFVNIDIDDTAKICQATWNVSQLILVHKRHLLKGYLWRLSRFLCRGYLCNWLFTFQVKLFTRTSEEPSLQDMNQAAWMTLHTLKYVRTNSREKALQIETNRDSSHNFVLKSSRCCSWFLLSLFWCWS